MSFKYFTFFLALCATLFAITAYSAQFNIQFTQAMAKSKLPINIDTTVYYQLDSGPSNVGTQVFKMQLPFGKAVEFFSNFQKMLAVKTLVRNKDGKESEISLGYLKDGENIFPRTCQNITIKSSTNILMSLGGCSVY